MTLNPGYRFCFNNECIKRTGYWPFNRAVRPIFFLTPSGYFRYCSKKTKTKNKKTLWSQEAFSPLDRNKKQL